MNNQIKPVAHIVLKFARRLTDSAIEADDIAQCAMLKVLKSKRQLEDMRVGWLYRITKNCVIDVKRSQAREAQYLDRNLFVCPAGTVCDSSAASRVVYLPTQEEPVSSYSCEEYVDLVKRLNVLPAGMKQVLVLHAHGFKYAEIADQLGINVGTVRSRLHYGRLMAKELLKEYA